MQQRFSGGVHDNSADNARDALIFANLWDAHGASGRRRVNWVYPSPASGSFPGGAVFP